MHSIVRLVDLYLYQFKVMSPIIKPMLKSIIYTPLLIVIFSGCSQYTPQITNSDKAKLVSEQIINNAQCVPFINSLQSPTLDSDAIDQIYHNATKAHCVNKDI